MVRISVSSLLFWCGLYLDYNSALPIESVNISNIFGSAVHSAISKVLKRNKDLCYGKQINLFEEVKTNEQIIDETISEFFKENSKESKIKNLIKTDISKMVDAAENFSKDQNYENVEFFFKYNFGISDFELIGIADVVGKNSVVDWKTGSYPSLSHEEQIKIYSAMLNRLGLVESPVKASLVYLGPTLKGDKPVVKSFVVTEQDINEIENKIVLFINDYLNNGAKANISTHCLYCPYRQWCDKSINDLEKESILEEIWRAQESNFLYQRQIINDFEEGMHFVGNFIVERKGNYLRIKKNT